jgi:hypothetical protein
MFRKIVLIPALVLVFGAVPVLTVLASSDILRARVIERVMGELPSIPGCPFHEACVKALVEERLSQLMEALYGDPRVPAVKDAGGVVFTAGERLFVLPSSHVRGLKRDAMFDLDEVPLKLAA